MKEKIFNQLKQDFSKLGLSDEILQSVASSLDATGLITDDNLATIIKGQESMLKSYQSNFDRLRTEGATYKKELEELKAKGSGGNQQQPANEECQSGLQGTKQEQEKRISELMTENQSAKAEQARTARNNLILSKAKELKISKERIEEGFAISDDMDEAAITNYLSKVRQNEVAKGLEDKGSAFSLSTPEDQGKELAKEWAESLPDAN